MIRHEKTGGRSVELFIPFELGKKKIDAITFGPLKLGHVMLWNEGNWPSMMEFMAHLADVEIAVLRELRYPDADRVTEVFMSMLTPEIRNDVEIGRVPQKIVEEQPVAATNGSGEPIQGPGTPLPPEMMQPGFDLGEEP
jgi:hypothetical protein